MNKCAIVNLSPKVQNISNPLFIVTNLFSESNNVLALTHCFFANSNAL